MGIIGEENEPAEEAPSEDFIKVSAEDFIQKFGEAKASLPEVISWRVDTLTAEDYKNVRTYCAKQGGTFAIKADGDIISLCRNSKSPVTGTALLNEAVRNGGSKLDSYEGNYRFYCRNGFEPVSWCKWDGRFAPDDWKKAKVKKEDIIFFKYTGKQYTEDKNDFKNRIKASKNYNNAMKKRDGVM